jgi:hypothetical protein
MLGGWNTRDYAMGKLQIGFDERLEPDLCALFTFGSAEVAVH